MHVRIKFLRITKFLGKAILALLLLVIINVAILHLPPVQKFITGKVSQYLTSKIGAPVDLERISFSVLGKVEINELIVSDPAGAQILSAHRIEVSANIYDLIMGDLTFDTVHLDRLDAKLKQSQDGLNIQFIIDAFKSKEKHTATKSKSVALHFNTVLVENISFEYTSQVNEIVVDVNLGTFTLQDAELVTAPFKIKADQLVLEHSVVEVLLTQQEARNTTASSTHEDFLQPDFGTGIKFEVRELTLRDDEVSYHNGQVRVPEKFDPAHIDLKNINLDVSDILIREDSLAARVKKLSAQLPGFTLTQAKATLGINQDQVFISELHINSGNNHAEANLIAPNSKSIKDTDPIVLSAQAQIDPADFSYFFSDSVLNQIGAWGPTELVIEGNYTLGHGEVKTLHLKSRNSLLDAEGIVNNMLDLEKVNWKNLAVHATIGSDFKKPFQFLKNIKLPPDLSLRLKSSGSLSKFSTDANVFTTWGDLHALGWVALQAGNTGIDLTLTGEKVDLGKWLTLSWLGPMDLSASAKGIIGNNQDVNVNGVINTIEIQKQRIHDVAFQTIARKDSATVAISIADPRYLAEINSEISFSGPLKFTNTIELNNFNLGRLLQTDSSLTLSAATKSYLLIEPSVLQGYVAGNQILFHKESRRYAMDTLDIRALISPTKSEVEYFTENSKANFNSNFDLREVAEVIQAWSGNLLRTPDPTMAAGGTRVMKFNLNLENANFIKLLGVDLDEFSSLSMVGEFDEQKQSTTLQATTGKFKGYGISLDTLQTHITVLRNSASAVINATKLSYNSIDLGDLDMDMVTQGDTAFTNLVMTKDTITLLGWRSAIVATDSSAFIHTNALKAFNHDFFIDPENSIQVGKNNLEMNHLRISRDSMQISMEGDLNTFDVSFKHVDLTPLNFLISTDTILINKGYLTGNISYARNQQLNLQAKIDSLILYNSSPLTLSAAAVTEDTQVPFNLLLTNESNKIDLQGQYSLQNTEVNASLLVDITNLEIVDFLVSGVVDNLHGAMKGKTTINGPLKNPVFKGSIHFTDVELTTIYPKLTFTIDEESILLDNTTLLFNQFKLYDKDHHSLTVNGNISYADFQSLGYDLQINSEEYTLINNPDSTSGKLRGQLVIDSDIKLKGNSKDTNIEANVSIKNATDLTLVAASEDIELIEGEGIVEFIDPSLLLDSATLEQAASFYDSLLATLPDFNLNSKISIEDNARFRVIINEQSGDYIAASGAADLELGYDRTGNLRLAGNYTINKGVYRLSFYDLVKKNFTLLPGSSINWRGSPKNGDLSIKATHTVESNSLGLIGQEIGENEKSIYKRSLNYEVGINIDGTIEKPIISFSLDLPKNEKVNYPVLANKLDRLRQPEYESELNKQVFGLLVLGGFLPESSGDVNSSVIATTALSNSVNSLLASQLNRFANQYIKGVNIDVGIQSFSDYSAPGGKTQTAMDFRVSKKMMNDRLSFEIGGDFDINQDQSGGNTGKNYRGDVAIIYDLTGNGDKQLKLFNNETYDIVYQEIRNTGISLILIREFEKENKDKHKKK
jgi:translocation and assembly module TamB